MPRKRCKATSCPRACRSFLAIISGYFFIHFFYLTRFRAQRQAGHRLLIEAAGAGSAFYIIARFATGSRGEDDLALVVWTLALGPVAALLTNFALACWVYASRHDGVPFTEPESVAHYWEGFTQELRRAALDRAVRNLGNDLLSLLHDAAVREDDPVLLTLENGKVYAGWVVRSPNLKPDELYVSLLPLASGHRDKDTLAMTLDLTYPVDAYEDPSSPVHASDFVIVLPIDSIRKAHFFDPNVYAEYFAKQEPGGAPRDPSITEWSKRHRRLRQLLAAKSRR